MKRVIIIGSTLLLNACASAPPPPTNKSVNVPVVESTDKDYIVKERNPDPAPEWTRDFSKFKRENENKGTSYFLGESGDVNDRIAGCDLANLTGKNKIAQQIAELITSKIAADKQGRLAIDPNDSNDPGIKRAFEEQIAGKSIAFLSGAKEYGTYWEHRDHSKSNGHKRVFNCSVLISISDKDLQAALMRSSQKTQDVVEDADAKAAVKDALKNIDADFKTYTFKN